MTLRPLLSRLLRARDGSMAVETAIVATVVALLSLGTFQVSSFVARQHELQGAAASAAAIALAAKPDTTEKLATIKSIIMTTTGLPTEKVSVSYRYGCGYWNFTSSDPTFCTNYFENRRWTYVRIVLTDSYQPIWTKYGVGSNVNLRVDRLVQIS